MACTAMACAVRRFQTIPLRLESVSCRTHTLTASVRVRLRKLRRARLLGESVSNGHHISTTPSWRHSLSSTALLAPSDRLDGLSRLPAIDIEHEKELYKFMHDIAKQRDVLVRRIGGMPDHVHLLCDIPTKLSVAEFIKVLKTETSKFMRVNSHFPLWNGWAEGYGCFSVDTSTRDIRKQYIMNQKEHHSRITFVDEFRNLLIEAGVPLDESVSK